MALAALCLLPAPGRGQAVFSSEDFRLLPLRIHLLRSKAPDLDSKLRESDARRVLGKINAIWKPAGLQFWAESIRSEEAHNQDLYTSLGQNRTESHLRLVRPRTSLSDRMFHLYYVRKMRPNGICLNASPQLLFVKDTAELDPVPGGIDEPLPRVSAHEIGHALGLPHRQDLLNLMASGTTGILLNEQEIRTARATAERFEWRLTPQAALKVADQRAREKSPEAQALYTALSQLPIGEVAKAARERLSTGSG